MLTKLSIYLSIWSIFVLIKVFSMHNCSITCPYCPYNIHYGVTLEHAFDIQIVNPSGTRGPHSKHTGLLTQNMYPGYARFVSHRIIKPHMGYGHHL